MTETATVYKASRFNYELRDDDELLLYNSCRGLYSCIKFGRKDNIERIQSLLNKGTVYCSEDSADRELIFLLKDRGFLVDLETEEGRLIDYFYGKVINGGILDLTIIPTRQCNFRCKYCYEKFSNDVMSDETQNSVIKFVRKNIHNYSAVKVDWFGGEPLLTLKTIEKINSAIMKICKNAKRNFFSSITTNGYLLTPEVFGMLLQNNVYKFQITLDGLEHTHNKNKPLISGKGTFEKIINNIVEIRSRYKTGSFKFVIRTNFDESSFDEAEEYLQYLGDILNGDKRFNLFIRTASDWGGENITDETKKSFLNQDKNIYYKISRMDNTVRFDNHSSFLNIGSGTCYAGHVGHFIIDHDGTLRKCTCKLDADLNNVGYLNNKGEFAIDSNKISKWVTGMKLDDECYECPFVFTCFNKCCSAVRAYNDDDIGKRCPVEVIQKESIFRLLNKDGYFERVD